MFMKPPNTPRPRSDSGINSSINSLRVSWLRPLLFDLMRSVNCGAINSSVTWPVESYEAVTLIPGRSRNVSATGSPYFFFKSSLDWATTAVQIIRRMTNAFNWTPFVLIEAANVALQRRAILSMSAYLSIATALNRVRSKRLLDCAKSDCVDTELVLLEFDNMQQ